MFLEYQLHPNTAVRLDVTLFILMTLKRRVVKEFLLRKLETQNSEAPFPSSVVGGEEEQEYYLHHFS